VGGVAHAETSEFRGYVRKPALALARREVDVHPGEVPRHETAQEACGEDVVALRLDGALQHVGDRALELVVEVLVHRKAPDALAARAAGRLDRLVQVAPVGERAAVPIGDCIYAGTGQRREVQQQRRLLARRQRQRVGQNHAPSASLCTTWIVTPFIARTTSCGR